MEELLNYAGRNRRSGLSGQIFTFLQNLSETARGLPNVVLAISIPKSELEMTTEDFEDYNRFGKLLDRVGKAITMSGESEISEIIRRRLFEWDLEVRKALAWEAINNEKDELPIDDALRRQIDGNLKSARDDMRQTVWRTYNHIAMLDKDKTIR